MGASELPAGPWDAAAVGQFPPAVVHGYDYLASVWLDGPLRLPGPLLEAWAGDLMPIASTVAERYARLIGLLRIPGERAAADEDYQGCLIVPQGGHYVPPYASCWLGDEHVLWSPATTGVLSYYARAGLDWAGMPAPQDSRPWLRAPDHLGVECAFVAETASQPETSHLAAGFIVGHLRSWVPGYAKELARHARSQYWHGMAELLNQWVQDDALLPVRPLTVAE